MKLPPENELGDATNTRAEQKTRFEQLRGVLAQLPGGALEATYTISATGRIKPTVTPFAVDTFGGAAADDLTHIDGEEGESLAGYPDGSVILLRGASDSRAVTVKHEAGGVAQISLMGGEFVLSSKKWLVLQLRGVNWVEVLRSFGGDAAAERAYFGLTKAATAPDPANPGDDGKALVAQAGALVWGTPLSTGGPAHRLLVSRITDVQPGPSDGSTWSLVAFDEVTLESAGAGVLWDPATHEIKIPAGITFIRVAANLEAGFNAVPIANWWVSAYSFYRESGGGYPGSPDGHSKAGLLASSLAGHASASSVGALHGHSGEIAVGAGDRLKLMIQAGSTGGGNVKVRGAALPAFCWLSAEFYA